jgi:hypothetical protein
VGAVGDAAQLVVFSTQSRPITANEWLEWNLKELHLATAVGVPDEPLPGCLAGIDTPR